MHVRVVHPFQAQFLDGYVCESCRDSDDQIARYVRVYQSLADKTTFSCSEPVVTPGCASAYLEDVLEHLYALQISTVEPAEPAFVLEALDHRFDPLRFVVGRLQTTVLRGDYSVGEGAIEAFHCVAVVAD